MKIIDLLNKIANKEDLPEKIKYYDEEFVFTGYDSKSQNYNNELEDLFEVLDGSALNDEVEILDDEEKGLPKKIEISEKSITVKGTTFFRDKDIEIFQKLSMQINEIIDYLKNQSKGEDE